MRLIGISIIGVFAAAFSQAQPRIDNVLESMVPPGANSLIGIHMDKVAQTELYKRMVASRILIQVDQFATATGFDPRGDVRELLLASTPQGSVMLARGNFHLNSGSLDHARQIRHGQYNIVRQGGSGFCILDSTLAAAGEIPILEAALDEWASGTHKTAQTLLARITAVNPQSHAWGVSTAAGAFLADHPTSINSGIDIARVFRSLQDTWFEADLSGGLQAEVHGNAGTEKDAVNLRDTIRGAVGLGRLNVPENQSELLRVWDGITVDQQGRSISLHVDIAQNLIDKMVEMLMPGPAGGRRVL